MFWLKKRERERIHLSSAFLSIQALKGLLSLLIQMLISPGNTFRDNSEITLYQLSGHPLTQSS